MVRHGLSGWTLFFFFFFFEDGAGPIGKSQRNRTLVFEITHTTFLDFPASSNMAIGVLNSVLTIMTVRMLFPFAPNREICNQILALPLTVYVTSDKLATWNLCFLF